MKKLTILLLIFSLLSIKSHAQNEAEAIKPIEFSLGAGIAVSAYSIEGMNANFDSNIGYNFFFKTDFNFENNWYIQTGISLINESGKHDVEIEDFEITNTTANILNLSIPIHLGYKFRLKSAKFSVGAGPYIMYGISGTDKDLRFFRDNDDYIGLSVKYKVFDLVKKTDIGMEARFGVEFDHFVASLDYNYGFTNISKIEGTTIKNNFALIGIAYKF